MAIVAVGVVVTAELRFNLRFDKSRIALQKVQECDATNDAILTAAGQQKFILPNLVKMHDKVIE